MSKEKKGYGFVAALYLIGIFMGAIDTGIVTPARTIIQYQLGVSEQTGIWMITIYTLAYAASVPIMGKLADKFGRKYVYITCICLFGIGSLFCGLSGTFGGFSLLIAARVVQALGGGGIVPIATAEFGTAFPEEKRGMALGLVGGVYGVANVFGASAGSLILDIFGTENWKYIFYINVPISLFIIISGVFVLVNHRHEENNNKLDLLGIFSLTVMVLSLLYSLKNLNFFDFVNSVTTAKVYIPFAIFVIFVPLFIFAEKYAKDPVISLEYFKNKNVLITLFLSTLSGVLMMGAIFVPQFCENCLMMPTGEGGYLVIVLGAFSGIGAPVSGKLIDKFGAKAILMVGFIFSALGALFMIFVTTKYPCVLTVIIGLALAGIGIGFSMGTPINYMMLDNTDPKKANSSLAAVSLVRSIGTAIAPAIMAGFIASAGMSVEANIMNVMPQVPGMENVQMISQSESTDEMSELMKPSDEMIAKLQSSDVTTIVDTMKELMREMFGKIMPGDKMPEEMYSMIVEGYMDKIDECKDDIEKVYQETLNFGYANIYKLLAIVCAIAMILLAFYSTKSKDSVEKNNCNNKSSI